MPRASTNTSLTRSQKTTAANSSKSGGKATEYQKKLFYALSGRIDGQFTSRHGKAWTHQWSGEKEHKGLLFTYALAAEVVGGEENAKLILCWLASTSNTKYLDYPPTPQQFIGLWRIIPKPMKPFRNKMLSKHRKITLKSRIWVNIIRMLSGRGVNERDNDIRDIVEYNFKKYQEHTDKHGIPVPGSKTYPYYEPMITIGEV